MKDQNERRGLDRLVKVEVGWLVAAIIVLVKDSLPESWLEVRGALFLAWVGVFLWMLCAPRKYRR